MVRLSFFMCNLGDGNAERIEEELQTRVIPVWEEIVSAGRGVQDYSYIFHWWADEWNVGQPRFRPPVSPLGITSHATPLSTRARRQANSYPDMRPRRMCRPSKPKYPALTT